MVNFRRTYLIVIFLLTSACSTQTPALSTLEIQAAPQVEPTKSPTQAIEPTEEAAPVAPTEGIETEAVQSNPETFPVDLSCLDDTTGPVAQSIAEQYASTTTYEEVGSWYCSGYAFEDILNALQTEPLVSPEDDMTAVEILQLLNQGFTWNEIWKVLDLTE